MEVDQALERLQSFSPRELLRKDSDRFYQELVSTVAELCGTEMNSLYTVAADRRRLVLQAAVGLPEQWLEQVRDVPIGQSETSGVCGRAAASKQVVIAPHFDNPILRYFLTASRKCGLAALLHSLSQFPISLDLIRYHHERFDGTGYPEGLSAENIPLAAHIVAVADAFDVMTTGRPYGRVHFLSV